MARKKLDKWLPFESAKEYVRSFGITSREEFWEWWESEKPRIIPKYPYRVYTKEWIGWANFLGTTNTWGKAKKTYRPYLEAIAYVHKLGCKNHHEYIEKWRAGELPPDLPANPWWVYKNEFLGWSHWLGNKVGAMIEGQQQIQQETRVLIIGQKHNVPSNVIWVGDVGGGLSAATEMAAKRKLKGFKAFKIHDDNWKNVVSSLTTKWWEDTTQLTSSNINELLFELSTQYEQLN